MSSTTKPPSSSPTAPSPRPHWQTFSPLNREVQLFVLCHVVVQYAAKAHFESVGFTVPQANYQADCVVGLLHSLTLIVFYPILLTFLGWWCVRICVCVCVSVSLFISFIHFQFY
jgi:hypothetical protein